MIQTKKIATGTAAVLFVTIFVASLFITKQEGVKADTFGYGTLPNTHWDIGDWKQIASCFTAPANGNISSITWGIGAGILVDEYANAEVGIFSSVGGVPTTLLASGHGTVHIYTGEHWNTIALSSPYSITEGTSYCLAAINFSNGDENYILYDSVAPQHGFGYGEVYDTEEFVSPFTDSDNYQFNSGYNTPIYATYTASSGGSSQPQNPRVIIFE